MLQEVRTSSGIAVLKGFNPETGLEVTGLDKNKGKVIHRTIFGQNKYGNGA